MNAERALRFGTDFAHQQEHPQSQTREIDYAR